MHKTATGSPAFQGAEPTRAAQGRRRAPAIPPRAERPYRSAAKRRPISRIDSASAGKCARDALGKGERALRRLARQPAAAARRQKRAQSRSAGSASRAGRASQSASAPTARMQTIASPP